MYKMVVLLLAVLTVSGCGASGLIPADTRSVSVAALVEAIEKQMPLPGSYVGTRPVFRIDIGTLRLTNDQVNVTPTFLDESRRLLTFHFNRIMTEPGSPYLQAIEFGPAEDIQTYYVTVNIKVEGIGGKTVIRQYRAQPF